MFAQSTKVDPNVTRLAREVISKEGTLPEGMLREEIASSWQRCLDFGLRLDQKPELLHLNQGELGVLRERNQRLITSSLPEMEALCRHFAPNDCVVMLSDANAAILKTLGDQRFLDKTTRYSLTPGSSWPENIGGTNAFGTVLKQEKPLMIQGGEHYFDLISGFTCSASPIFDPTGQIAGVLDVTSEDRHGANHNLGLVSMSTRLIESRLFSDYYREQIVIAAHQRPEFVDSLWQGLLAFSPDGKLLAVSREAGVCLGLDPLNLHGQEFENLFGVAITQILNQSLSSPRKPLILRHADQQPLYARLLHMPGAGQVSVQVSQPVQSKSRPRPVSDRAITLDDVTWEDAEYRLAASRCAKALNHQIPLLLLGETGSGKEVLAQALHRESNRQGKPFIALNCAAIPEGLIESELFGYQEGAFTGARRGGMQGKVQQAHGGVLFLDEIGDMPLDMQARLLRVLQERSITPLGSSKLIPVDITLICATHRDLKQMVAEGRFREDLYYRLNGVAIRIPPLRERHNLPGFIRQLLQREAGSGHGIDIDPDLMERLAGYPWPGNVRQLQTVLKTCLAFMEADEHLISEELLTEDFRQELNASSHAGTGKADNAAPAGCAPKTLKNAQIDLIKQAIETNGGNMSAAALSLGISRATLYRRLQQAGIKVVSDKQILDS